MQRVMRDARIQIHCKVSTRWNDRMVLFGWPCGAHDTAQGSHGSPANAHCRLPLAAHKCLFFMKQVLELALTVSLETNNIRLERLIG